MGEKGEGVYSGNPRSPPVCLSVSVKKACAPEVEEKAIFSANGEGVLGDDNGKRIG